MSTAPSPAADAAPPRPLTVVSHTGLIYWWPVWLVGLVLAALTYFEDNRLAVLPPGTTARPGGTDKVYEVTVPVESPVLRDAAAAGAEAFPVRISRNTDYGMVYVAVLLAVAFGANVPLRGMASVAAVLFLVLVTVVFAFLGWWGKIFEAVGGWHVQITFAGYLVPSVGLLVLWLLTILLYDPLRYLRISPGQLIVHKDIGDQSEAYGTTGFVVEKRRTDLFRHWVLGLGAGDLIIKLPGQGFVIEFPNVLVVDKRVAQIAELMKTRPMVHG
jgi:hypothetical protein